MSLVLCLVRALSLRSYCIACIDSLRFRVTALSGSRWCACFYCGSDCSVSRAGFGAGGYGRSGWIRDGGKQEEEPVAKEMVTGCSVVTA